MNANHATCSHDPMHICADRAVCSVSVPAWRGLPLHCNEMHVFVVHSTRVVYIERVPRALSPLLPNTHDTSPLCSVYACRSPSPKWHGIPFWSMYFTSGCNNAGSNAIWGSNELCEITPFFHLFSSRVSIRLVRLLTRTDVCHLSASSTYLFI